MALRNEIEMMLDHINNQSKFFRHNENIFNVLEGDLLPQVLGDLKAQLSKKAFAIAEQRVAPINVLNKINDKLSQLYKQPPKRILEKKRSNDKRLLEFYTENMEINVEMAESNRLFNPMKSVFVELAIVDRKPTLRVMPNHMFTVIGTRPDDRKRVTHYIKHMGEVMVGSKKNNLYYAYTDEEFLPFLDDGTVFTQVLTETGNPNGINPIGRIPGVYINRSRQLIIPKSDTDTLRMTKLIPVLLTDLNFAVMFQSFAVIYTIDADIENAEFSPNSLWNIKSDANSDKQPTIGSIKPEVDIEVVNSHILKLVQFWLLTRGIKPGGLGDMSIENLASGVSKVLDEMDTSDERTKQVPIFKNAEEDLWSLIINHAHPHWVQEKLIDTIDEWSANQEISVEFPDQRPIVDRGKIIDEQVKERDSGLTTQMRALKTLNPDMSEDQLLELQKEIDEEGQVNIQENPVPPSLPQEETEEEEEENQE